MTAAAGYSGTPLAQKLGYGGRGPVWVRDMPPAVRAQIEAGAHVAWTASGAAATDAHLFVLRRSELDGLLAQALAHLPPDAAIWISWPKKTARLDTDLTEDVIREAALPLGLVDVKVCAVDGTWSGLKLVLRKELRPGGRTR